MQPSTTLLVPMVSLATFAHVIPIGRTVRHRAMPVSGCTQNGGRRRCRPSLLGGMGHSQPHRGRSSLAAAAQPQMSGGMDPETQALIEESSQHIDEMVSEILTAASTERLTALVTGEAPDFSESDLVKEAVARRIETLNDTFMTTIMAYIEQVAAVGDATYAAVVLAIREQVLEQLSTRMPPEPRVLDRLLAMDSSSDRIEALNIVANGGGVVQGNTTMPSCTMERIITAATHFIEELEDYAEVPDLQMLSRLVIIREEAVNVDLNLRRSRGEVDAETNPLLVSQTVPVTEIAFIKQLMVLTESFARCGYIEKAFVEGWSGGAVSNKGPSTSDAPEQAVAEGEGKPGRAALRPGRFLLSLDAAQAEMLQRAEQGTGEVSAATLERVEAIRRDVLTVLRRLSERPA